MKNFIQKYKNSVNLGETKHCGRNVFDFIYDIAAFSHKT